MKLESIAKSLEVIENGLITHHSQDYIAKSDIEGVLLALRTLTALINEEVAK